MNNQSGYIALISTIIISALLVTIVVVLNLFGFLGRFNILDSEFKEASASLAESCVDTAMLELIKGNVPSSNTVIPVGGEECTIVSVTGSGTYTITTRANYQEAYTNLQVSFTPSSNTVNSWLETP